MDTSEVSTVSAATVANFLAIFSQDVNHVKTASQENNQSLSQDILHQHLLRDISQLIVNWQLSCNM